MGVSSDLAKEMDNELAIICGRLTSERNGLRIQLVGSGIVVAVVALGLSSGIIPLMGDLSATIKSVAITLFGIGIAGLAGSAWRIATFSKRACAELERTVEAQLARVCDASEANLAREEKEEGQAFGAVEINVTGLANAFTYEGLQTLHARLMEQMKDLLDSLESQCKLEQKLAARRMLANLQGYCSYCRKHTMDTAEKCAQSLHGGALSAMSGRIKAIDSKLNDLKAETEKMESQLRDSESTLSRISEDTLT